MPPPERKGGGEVKGGPDAAGGRKHVHARHSYTQVLMWYICALTFKYGCDLVVLRFRRESTIYFQPRFHFHLSGIKFHHLLHCKGWRRSSKIQRVHTNSSGAKKQLKHVLWIVTPHWNLPDMCVYFVITYFSLTSISSLASRPMKTDGALNEGTANLEKKHSHILLMLAA